MYEFKHIVIDGWNVIHSNPRLKKLLTQLSQEAARAELAHMLAPIHDYGGARVTIVYDGSGDEISIVRPNEILTFSEVYTPSFLTADELIEQLCSTSKNPDRILVVTRDNLLRLTASSFGALSISPDKIFEWSTHAQSGLTNAAQANNRKAQRSWQQANPFSDLDTLAIDIGEVVKRSELVSKHLKKRARRAAVLMAKNGAINSVGAENPRPDKIVNKDAKSVASDSGQSAKTSPKQVKPKAISKSFDDLKKIPDTIVPKSTMFNRARAKYYFGESGASGNAGLTPKRKIKRNKG